MQMEKCDRIGLFIDGASFFAAARSLGLDVDFKKLISCFRQKGRLVGALYFTTVTENEESSSIRPLLDWLEYNGFTLVTKPTKVFTDERGRRKYKGSINVELTIGAMSLAPSLDQIIIFTGDSDFQVLVAALQEQGKRVSIVSTLETQPPMIADELRRQADEFIDLVQLERSIARDPRPRTPAHSDPN